LPIFRNSFIVSCNIDKVWKFYTDVKHVEVITPKEVQLKIVRTTSQTLMQGTDVWLSGKLIFRHTWHSKIIYLKPYEYVDEMLSGLFKKWKHLHKFQTIDENRTEVIDEIDFELPLGFLGRMFEGYAHDRMRHIFAYRETATANALEHSS